MTFCNKRTFLQCKNRANVRLRCQSRRPACCWLGWAARWCSDWLLVKPEEEGGDNPRTDGPHPSRWQSCLQRASGDHGAAVPPRVLLPRRTRRIVVCVRAGTRRADRRVALFPLLSARFSFPSGRCASFRSSPPSDAGSAASDQGLIRVLASDRVSFCEAHHVWLINKKKKKKNNEPALDCLPIKGIMIFSDMSTGTNSPKVHPPNGTRFYTFQAS